jgi:hypothetical protein
MIIEEYNVALHDEDYIFDEETGDITVRREVASKCSIDEFDVGDIIRVRFIDEDDSPIVVYKRIADTDFRLEHVY